MCSSSVKVLFCSNYLTHHQVPLSDALYELTEHNYSFIAYKQMDSDRKNLGWDSGFMRPYARSADSDSVITESDLLIAGSFPESELKRYIDRSKLLFRYSERPLKDGNRLYKYPVRLIRWNLRNPPRRKTYMLCASAYTAGDYAKFGLFRRRCYKWGYFPETVHYPNIDELIAAKDKATIVWCGRFLQLKHPETVIELARRLKESGYKFKINMIGTGENQAQLVEKAAAYGLLDENIFFLGTMSTQSVRRHMEQAGIFLFTSDRKEGWGAVVNEAMNSACAVVASDAAGCVPFLLDDGRNGSVYHSGDIDELYRKVSALLDNYRVQASFGKAAYLTITELWNEKVAAQRLLQLAQAIMDGNDSPDLFESGPCSRADIISEDWYK